MFKKVDLSLRTNNAKWANPEQRVSDLKSVPAAASAALPQCRASRVLLQRCCLCWSCFVCCLDSGSLSTVPKMQNVSTNTPVFLKCK